MGLVIISIPICAWMWAFGGAANTSKWWRRIGCPVVIILPILLHYRIWWLALAGIALHFAFRLGYGVPDSTDEGSDIGRLWFGIFKQGNETRFNRSEMTAFLTNLMTRFSVGVIYGLALLPLRAVGNWFLGAIFIVINTVVWNVYIPPKEFKIFKTKYNTSEAFTGLGIGIGAFLAIL